MKNKKKTSIRKNIFRLNVIILIGVFAIVLFYTILNQMSIDKYNNAFQQYSKVSKFYSCLESANSNFKDYLYTDGESSWTAFEEEVAKAKEHLDDLQMYNQEEEGWRFVQLQHMVDDYVAQGNETKKVFHDGDAQYALHYTDFLHAYELINNTSDIYYKLLTDHMELQNQQFTMIKAIATPLSIAFVGMMFLWMFYFTYLIVRGFSEPLSKIMRNIEKVKRSEYDLTNISNTTIEMDDLCVALDEMATTIQHDIEVVKEKAELEKLLLETENENLKKDELLAQSEVKMLQNQINPHFLFNTLNMAYKLALQESAGRTAEIIERTSALLRYGLDKQNRLSDIRSEVEAAKNYIIIQERRLGDRVHFELNFDEQVPNIAIPGMILQPLIENAIKHGLQDRISDGEIIVNVKSYENYLYLSVTDNGKGMNSDEVEDYMLNGFENKESNHLGLYNVWKRLDSFFQERIDISINSAEDCGFEFIIKIEVSE